MARKIGIQAAPFSKEIHAGVLASDGRTYVSGYPQDVTRDAGIEQEDEG